MKTTAQDHSIALRRQAYARKGELRDEADKKWRGEGWPDKMRDAEEAAAAERAENAKIAHAAAGEKFKDVIGKTVRREKPGRWAHSTKTLLRGVVEIFGPGSDYPSNLADYSIPSAGTMIVRLLKKDGTPGTLFEKLPNASAHDNGVIGGTASWNQIKWYFEEDTTP